MSLKNRKHILFYLFVFGAAFIGVSALVMTIKKSDSLRDNDSIDNSAAELRVINEFWQASVEGNKEKVDNLTVKAAPDIFINDGLCPDNNSAANVGENEPSSLPKVSATGISNNSIENNYDNLHKLSFSIQDKNYKIFKVTEVRNNGKNAVVKTIFGTDDFPYYSGVFLLTKKDGEWKIFMTTNEGSLTSFDVSFAKTQCEN